MASFAARMKRQLCASRVTLFTVGLPMAVLAAGMMETVQPVLRVAYIVLGFSLIIFLHELGHFAVARMCSVKCLAFSIGIGPRFCGWRKGAGLTFGADPYDPDKLRASVANHPASTVHSDLPTTAHGLQHPKSVGDCDYRISYAPLGGYVRMLGQDDMDPNKVSTDPHSFNQRPIWQRMCIVSAGVIMNLIFAAVCFSIIFSPGIGVEFPPAKIGVVEYDSPAWKEGIRPGDEVVAINDKPYRGFLEFTDIQMEAALSSGADAIKFKVKHPDGSVEEKSILPKRSASTGFLAIGVAAMPGLKIGGKGAEYVSAGAEKAMGHRPSFQLNKAELAKLDEEGYKIIKVDDIDLRDTAGTHDKYIPLSNAINAKNGQPVTLTVEHTKKHGITRTMVLYPYLELTMGVDQYPAVFGLEPQVVINATMAKSPAALAKLEAGDRIMRVGDRAAPSLRQVRELIRGTNGDAFTIAVERPAAGASAPGAATLPMSPSFPVVTLAAKKGKTGDYQIGVSLSQDLSSTRFVQSMKVGDESEGPLPVNASIAALDGRAVKNWEEIYAYLRGKNIDDKVKVTFDSGSEKVDRTYTFTKEQATAVNEQLRYLLGLNLENETKNQVASNKGEAVLMGMDHTKKFILNVYMTLAGLARRTVDPSNLHGIVGITKIGYDVQERGPVWLWYILAMVSVNLAVANFLPLPIVDGGLFLLLILEKIRGKPLSLKVQTAIQTVGIVLLAGLFIFVTINDIGLFTK